MSRFIVSWAEQQERERQLQHAHRRAWLVAMASEFDDQSSMAAALGIDRTAMLRMARHLDVPMPDGRKGCSRESARLFDREEAARLYMAGEGSTAIARRFGVTPSAVWHALSKMGVIKTRKQQEQAEQLTVDALPPRMRARYETLRREMRKSHMEALRCLYAAAAAE